MRKRISFLFLVLCTVSSLLAQRQSNTLKLEIKPVDGVGFSGSVDLLYAFNNCFGEAQMLYTYDNLLVDYFYYRGRKYSADMLGLEDFKEYLQSLDVYLATIEEPTYTKDGKPNYGGIEGGLRQIRKSAVQLENVLQTPLTGCFGQTYRIGLNTIVNPAYLYIPMSEESFADVNESPALIEKIYCLRNPRTCREREKALEAQDNTENKR